MSESVVQSESNSSTAIDTEEESAPMKSKMSTTEFYSIAENYWKTQPATVDGMLGGYENISDTDILQSQAFLSYFIQVILLI